MGELRRIYGSIVDWRLARILRQPVGGDVVLATATSTGLPVRCVHSAGLPLLSLTRRGCPIPHRKPLFPLLNGFLLTELGKKHGRVRCRLAPNAANQFTRGGFLECAEQANPLPSWLHHGRLRV